MVGDIINGVLDLGQMAIGLAAGGRAKKQGMGLYSQGQKELDATMSTWKDYESSGELKSQYNKLNTQTGGRSTLTGLMQENADRSMANYLDVIRKGSVSGAQLSGGAANAANAYGANMNKAAIAGYEDNMQKQRMMTGLAGQLESANMNKFNMNLMPYLQKIENAQGKMGYGLNMYNQGVAGQTGVMSAGLGALDLGFLNNIDWGKPKYGKNSFGGKSGGTYNDIRTYKRRT